MALGNINDNAMKVLEKRYLAKNEYGEVTEDVSGLFMRVARAVAAADANYDPNADVEAVANGFYALMTSLRFLPNSPTLMNAGRPLGQLSACFVLPVGDSMEDIFEAVKNALEAAGLTPELAEVTMRAENTIDLTGDDAAKMQKLLDVLEDLDDVQDVFHNATVEAV